MAAKRAGCCTQCDAECYEVTRRRPVSREIVRLGRPLDIARKATFVLMDGTTMDLTMCSDCADAVRPDQYLGLWRKVFSGWVATAGCDHPDLKRQIDNGIVGLLRVTPIEGRK